MRCESDLSLRGHEGWVSFSPDGKRLALAWSGESDDNFDIYVKGIDDDSRVRLTTDPEMDWSPAWSPDGRAIAFLRGCPSWSRDGRSVYFSSNRSGAYEIWKTALDEPARLLQVTHGGGRGPRESTDGHQLLYTKRTDSALEIWSTGVNGGAETRLLGPIQSRAGWVPDHPGIYFIEPARRIAYYRFATGDISPITALAKQPSAFNTGLALSPDGRWLLYTQLDRSGADIMLVENFR